MFTSSGREIPMMAGATAVPAGPGSNGAPVGERPLTRPRERLPYK